MTDTENRFADSARSRRTGRPARRRRLLRPTLVVPAVVVGLVLGGIGAFLLQPWKVFVNDVVDDALPGVRAGERPGAAPTVLASGRFVSQEHDTTGTVRVLRLSDGGRILRIDDLDTSNGPALRVWITDAEVVTGPSGWFVFDDGRYVDLGALRGNLGDQNYPLPTDVDLDKLTSVSIWCERFSVSFGAAELDPRA
jgi:hypothetical protein